MTCPYLDGFEFGYQPTPTDIVEGHLHRRCGACRQVVPNSDGLIDEPLPQNGFRPRRPPLPLVLWRPLKCASAWLPE